MRRNLLRIDQVIERIGNVSKTGIWRMRKEGQFPEPVRISKAQVAWYEDEIDEWINTRERVDLKS